MAAYSGVRGPSFETDLTVFLRMKEVPRSEPLNPPLHKGVCGIFWPTTDLTPNPINSASRVPS